MKIGVFIGSFNPIHNGHVAVCDHLINNKYLEKIIIVPTLNLMDKRIITDLSQRMDMIELLNKHYFILDKTYNKLEFTYQILKELNADYLNDDLYLIISKDDLIDFNKWERHEEIIRNNKVIVMNRNNQDLKQYIEQFENKNNFIIIDDFPYIEINSNLLSANPDNYIKENKIYENKKIKHVIVAGAARSGKTTLSLMLNEYGYTHYKMDSIKRGICESFNIKYDDWESVSPIICKIINRVIVDNKTDTNYLKENYLFDTPFIYPKDIGLIDTSDTKVLFIGYKDIDPNEEIKLIRENDNENFWTSKITDEELMKWTKDNIEFSKYLEEECKKYNIKYFDTSKDRNNVLKEALEYILK